LLVVSQQVAASMWRGATDPTTDLKRKLMVMRGFIASGLRLARSTRIDKLGPRPKERFTLWDFERCSASRSVREALSMLDLDADVRPCPVGGTRFRPELEGGGVPRLKDPNTGDLITGSQKIVRHLYKHYGVGSGPTVMIANPIRILTGLPIRALTADIGSRAQPSRAPAQPLELYSFESSPYCRFARAKLSELELPYTLHNVAKGSPRRPEFIARSGKLQVPWLFDPNTGQGIFNSLEIERYLQSTYGA
jgi:glutathione S-transferase